MWFGYMQGENFGKRIELLRKNAKLSQSEFASLVGITQSALIKIENGETLVDFALLKRIATAMRCDISWLMYGTETVMDHRR